MYALVYASTATQPFDEFSLRELAQQAADKNGTLQITGYLYYSDRSFFQYLEGQKTKVLELFETIVRDERHTLNNKLLLGDRDQRMFPDWSMKYLLPKTMRRFHMEDVLQSVLSTMVQPVFDTKETTAHVERLLRSIARRQTDLTTAMNSE